MYHEVAERRELGARQSSPIVVADGYEDSLPSWLFVYRDQFEAQMQWLHLRRFRTLTLADIAGFMYEGAALPERSVLITFDDMYQSVAASAYPVLKRYRMHAVAFVVAGWVFEKPLPRTPGKSVCLSWDELRGMLDVFEPANHSAHLHVRNASGTGLEQCSAKAFRADVMAAEEALDRLRPSGVRTFAFAYPFGVRTGIADAGLRQLGLRLAFTTDGGSNNSATHALALHRNGVFLDCDLIRFAEIFNDRQQRAGCNKRAGWKEQAE